MNEWLAQYFGTAPVGEDTEKQASADLFVKLAMENGIDLNAMTDGEVAELYASTMGKMAESEDDEEKKKVEEAKREHEEKKESAAKFAEAVFMGQTMAHSFTAELDKIAARNPGAGNLPPAAASKLRRGLETARAHVTEFGANVLGSKTRAAEKALANLKNREGHVAGGTKLEGSMAKHIEKLRKSSRNARIGAGAGAAGLAAAGGGAYAASRDKKSSALDELAAEHAVAKVASAGWDADEAIDRIGAILTLGVDDESSKVAFTQSLDEAVEVRSLELAEAAGYPVNWPE